MQKIFEQTIEAVKKGGRFSIDLQGKNLRVNSKYIIRDGKLPEGAKPLKFEGDPVQHLIQLHDRYVHSVPSQRSNSASRLYFRALPEHELSMEDMMFGEPREEARCRLELTLLLFILSGTVTWETFSKGDERMWFWQSSRNTQPAMVVIKQYCLNPYSDGSKAQN